MNVERIPVRIYEDSAAASAAVARRIAGVVAARAAEGRPAVLGLAAGNTPVNVYMELIRLHRAGRLDLSSAVVFGLDEYWPIDPDAVQSHRSWIRENFLRHVNIPPDSVHLPASDVAAADLEAHCRAYGQAIAAAGGIDILVLGIGRSGHLGFNEPLSARDSRCRPVRLDRFTRMDAASDFFGEENVPEQAVTLGVGNILDAREVCLLAFGEHKAGIVRRAVEGPAGPHAPASFLQGHPNAAFYVDAAAADQLKRVATPWLLGPCPWDQPLALQAAVWLARKVGKPPLKLTDEDYVANGLAELRAHAGGAEASNLAAFRRLMSTITGHPGGREGGGRVLVLSPHPDDDVICMGGTIMRMVEDGHDVHVAYMVSGFLSVFDHDVARYADFVRQFDRIFGLTPEQAEAVDRDVDRFLAAKRPGDVDTPAVQRIKALIRRTEATDAARYCGVRDDHVHFLDMPFYNTGKVQKHAIGPDDVAAVRAVLEVAAPDMVFAAGDMSDPHGTHRLCLEAALSALDGRAADGRGRPDLWLYRGAWDEWPPQQIDMAVPLSPDELKRKRFAIFRHQSQKDRAMFPGPYDSREFWQRAEERNMATAALYDALGLPEYHALEAFVRHPPSRPTSLLAQLARTEDAP